MSTDKQTLDAYQEAAARYASQFAARRDTDQEADFAAFTARLPDGGRVIDFGCGPGHWAARFAKAGYRADALDASPAMIDLAKDRFGIDVQLAAFDAFEAEGLYDGIWANFSLLHAPRADFAGHLARLHRALKPGGALSLGMKLGRGEARDKLGRFYSYYSEDELREALATAGFTVLNTRRGNGEGLAGGVETFIVVQADA